MAQVKWMPQSLEDIEAIRASIAEHSQQNAARFVARVFNAGEHLADFPEMGRIMPRYSRRNVRELILRRHKLIYRLAGDNVEILAVLYGSQEFYSFELML